MIKYVIKTGCKFLNTKARNIKELAFKNQLKGMHCKMCRENTIIEFTQSELSNVKTEINACCSRFEARIRMNLNKYSFVLNGET
jgi:hypothetical protein